MFSHKPLDQPNILGTRLSTSNHLTLAHATYEIACLPSESCKKTFSLFPFAEDKEHGHIGDLSLMVMPT